ncbi:hypothetical protein YC2023_088413 [Brassica napus]
MGVLDHVSEMFDCSHGHKIKKRRQLQISSLITALSVFTMLSIIIVVITIVNSLGHSISTVEIKVTMDCEGCERKVRRSVEGMKGVSSVSLEPKAHKVTVVGYVDPNKRMFHWAWPRTGPVHRTGKKVELWPYVPYDVVAHPYAAGVYDKKAPSGYVRRADDPGVSQLARASSTEVRYTTAFSDENPAACVLM